MDMNLFDKAAEFEKLCNFFVKKAQVQIDKNKPFVFREEIPPASLSGPVPRFSAPTAPEPASYNTWLQNFANNLINFNPEKWAGTSVDVNALKAAGNNLNLAIKNNKPADMLKALENILHLTRDGGSYLYGIAKDYYNTLQKSMPKPVAKSQPKPVSWLDRYMTEEKTKEEADQAISGMHASLDKGHSLQDTFNRSNVVPTVK